MNILLNPVLFTKIAKSYFFDVNRLWRSTPEEIKKYQDKAFRKIIKYAYTVPLYHEKYKSVGVHPDDISGIKDINKLPFITKKDLRGKKADMLLPRDFDVKKYSMASTSGSTGKPVTLYSDPYTIFKTMIGFVRMIKEHGINWRKNRMAIIADLSPDSAEDAYFSRTALPNLNSIFSLENMKAFHVGDPPEKIMDEMESFNPEFIGGYPGIIKILAILKKKGKGKNIKPCWIATSGAILDSHTRNVIEKTFETKLFDVYGATECSPMIFECRNGNYHIHSDFVYMEFMDPQKKEEISGDGGNIVVTRLFGRGTPIIRYTGISDFVVPTKKKCDCNLSSPLVKKIEGRRVDSIVLSDGNIIPPSSFTGIPHHVMHKLDTDKIQQFQIIQQNKRNIDILIVIDENLRDVGPSVNKIFEELKKSFKEKLGEEININIKDVNKITAVRPGSSTPPPVAISKVKE